jgi:hypothetical protein
MSTTLARLRAANPGLNLMTVADAAFARYGRLLSAWDPQEMLRRAKAILPASNKVVYAPSVAELEVPCALNTAIQQAVYGGMPVQVGWCFGVNSRMGALEYHKGVEVNVCLTDVVLLMGDARDISFGDEIRYDTRNVAAFYAPEGAVIECHAWNLHFAPMHTLAGGSFATLVYLPKGTNERLPFAVPKTGEGRLLFGVNKWLIAHPGVQGLMAQGAYPALVGDDIVVQPA